VSDHDFLFTLRLADDGTSDQMLSDLTASVLRHVGYTPAEIDELLRQVRAGIAKGRAAGAEYGLQFRAHAGELDITVLLGDRRLFQTSRRLP
jgi:hypothetical protein